MHSPKTDAVKVDAAAPTRALLDSAVRRDVSKKIFEAPVRKLIKGWGKHTKPDLHKIVDNPKTQPGLVQWHQNWEQALRASTNSGKPVLLFQLLGNLDQRFL